MDQTERAAVIPGRRAALLRHTHLDVIPGRRQVGPADLTANPESISPGGDVGPRLTTQPVVMDSGLRSLRSRPRNDGAVWFVTR
jgi:hypothetical protein